MVPEYSILHTETQINFIVLKYNFDIQILVFIAEVEIKLQGNKFK